MLPFNQSQARLCTYMQTCVVLEFSFCSGPVIYCTNAARKSDAWFIFFSTVRAMDHLFSGQILLLLVWAIRCVWLWHHNPHSLLLDPLLLWLESFQYLLEVSDWALWLYAVLMLVLISTAWFAFVKISDFFHQNRLMCKVMICLPLQITELWKEKR